MKMVEDVKKLLSMQETPLIASVLLGLMGSSVKITLMTVTLILVLMVCVWIW